MAKKNDLLAKAGLSSPLTSSQSINSFKSNSSKKDDKVINNNYSTSTPKENRNIQLNNSRTPADNSNKKSDKYLKIKSSIKRKDVSICSEDSDDDNDDTLISQKRTKKKAKKQLMLNSDSESSDCNELLLDESSQSNSYNNINKSIEYESNNCLNQNDLINTSYKSNEEPIIVSTATMDNVLSTIDEKFKVICFFC